MKELIGVLIGGALVLVGLFFWLYLILKNLQDNQSLLSQNLNKESR